jgi:hypothetical protein
MKERVTELSGVSFIRIPILCMKASLSRPNHLPKATTPGMITLKLRMYDFKREISIQCIAGKNDIFKHLILVLSSSFPQGT